MASQTIEPPTTMDGYWLTPFGTPGNGSNNTTYIIGHSWEGRDAPFNHLSSAATIGDELNVITGTGTIRYRADSVTTYLKSTLKDSPIWDMVPSRLVLISCYTEDPWGKNVVVSASPVA
ncbi:sortase (surface protein transpeptidase) [Arthrobacter pascens]|uniref:class F sortase n=1 Tax=Arthrobacter pascens TaxID=1677 RepID=UPI00278EB72B|nr:sortase (surface protein transpeptidase) [Arthrobacter pascens]